MINSMNMRIICFLYRKQWNQNATFGVKVGYKVGYKFGCFPASTAPKISAM